MAVNDVQQGPAPAGPPPDSLPGQPLPGAPPGGISGFTGALGAGLPSSNVPFVPPAAIIGAGPQQGAAPPPGGPMGSPIGPLSGAGFAAQQIHNLDARKGIIGAEAENQAAGAQATADLNTAAADKFAAQQLDQKAEWEKAQKTVNDRNEELRQNVQKASAEQVDPNRLWKNKSTGGKILTGLGVALGAAGAGLLHSGTNGAMQIFQSAIDADIAAQKDNIANSWKGVQEKHGLDNDEQTRALHAQTWADNYRVAGLENVKLQLQGAAAKTSSVSVKNNAANTILDVDNSIGNIRNGQYNAQMTAQAAGSARAEKLAGEARAMFSKLVEKEGTDPAAAQKVVDSQFPQLKGTAFASAGQKAEQVNEVTAQNLARQMVAASNGAVTLDQALKAAKTKVEVANPAYGASAGGPLSVPKDQRDAATQYGARLEQLDAFDPKIINPSLVEGLPGADRNKVLAQQQSYANFARQQALANYHAVTGAARPPGPEALDQMVAQYLPAGAHESVARTKMRIDALRHDTEEAAKAKGVPIGGKGPAGAAAPAPFVPAAGAPRGSADPFVPTGAPIPSASPPPPAPERERAQSFRQ